MNKFIKNLCLHFAQHTCGTPCSLCLCVEKNRSFQHRDAEGAEFHRAQISVKCTGYYLTPPYSEIAGS